MNRSALCLLMLTFALGTPATGMACGEGVFSMGQGLRYQGFLAARPAAVLIYDADRKPADDRISVYRGLLRAGHSLTIAHSSAELADALARKRFDVVIAGPDTLDTVAALSTRGPAPRQLPVVERGQSTPEMAGRFRQFLFDGASLGRYLKLINQIMEN